MTFFLCVLGMVLVIEGVPYFCFPSQVKALSEKLPKIPDNTLRMLGLWLMVAGLIVIYIGRNS